MAQLIGARGQRGRLKMDNKRYFTDNQEVLLWLANTSAGKHLIGAKPSDKIVKLSPNSFHRLEAIEKDKFILTGVFRTYENVAKELLPILTMSQIAQMPVRDEKWVEHAAGLSLNNQYPIIYLDSATLYSGTGDGWIIYDGTSSFSTARNAATGTNMSYTGSTGFRDVAVYVNAGQYTIGRTFLPVDTSSLTTSATVSDALLKVKVYEFGGTSLNSVVVATTQASTSTLSTADYDAVGSTAFSNTVTLSSTGYKTWTLNATGIAALTLDGWTKMGIRNLQYDINNSDPGTAVNNRYVKFYYANNTGTASDPYYEVTYTLPVAGNAIFFGTNF